MLGFLHVAGGVALILFGVRFLRKGLDRIIGQRLSHWMRRMARNRWRAFGAGVVTGTIVPSSTTITFLSVQSLQAGHMTPPQMLAVILGANIGLTVMVQLIAFRIEELAPVAILFGVLAFQYARSALWRGFGQVTVSLGFIFLAIQIIKGATAGIFTSDPEQAGDLAKLIEIIENYPFWLALLAAALTMAMQSSTATIGLIIAMAAAGAESLHVAVPVVLGANVGLAITTLAVGWRQADSRNMALANLLLKAALAGAALAAMPAVAAAVQAIPTNTTHQIAHSHTLFNVLVALVGLPVVGAITRFISRFLPMPERDAQPFGPRYIQPGPVDSAALALGQSRREIMRVSEIVRGMLADLWRALEHNDEELARAVSERDDQVDLLDGHIKRYLVHLGSQLDEIANSREQMLQLSYITELETIGDIIDKNLSELVVKKIRVGASFYSESWKELEDFYRKVAENLLIAETAFATRDRLLAQQLARHKDYLSRQEYELRDRHFDRLNRGLTTGEMTSILLDIVGNLKRINSSVSHLAFALLQDHAHGDRTEALPGAEERPASVG